MKEYFIKDKIVNILKHFRFREPMERMERERAIARACNEIHREMEAAHQRFCKHMDQIIFTIIRDEFK